MMPLIDARAVTMQYRPGDPPAVSCASLAVGVGESVGVVGESGSGKSTLARLVGGVLTPTLGSVLVAGRSWGEIRRRDPVRRTVQMIFQEPVGALNPWMTALETVTEAVRHWDRDSDAEASDVAKSLLSETGLTLSAMERKPRELSGGQCQRVGIARALACKPRLLIADEPTSSLDVSVQAQILNTLLDLKASHGLALLLISHDLSVVRYMTETALVMYQGRIVEYDATDRLLGSPRHPYTQELVDSIPGELDVAEVEQNAAVQTDVPEHHPCAYARRCRERQPDCVGLPVAQPEHAVGFVECVHPLPAGAGQVPVVSGRLAEMTDRTQS